VETIYGDDGGTPQIREDRKIRNVDDDDDVDDATTTTTTTTTAPPANPGDIKGCSDFDTYEGALRWYEYYYQWYGDVANLDRNNDGIPCPALPHTQNQQRYRMKIPKRIQ